MMTKSYMMFADDVMNVVAVKMLSMIDVDYRNDDDNSHEDLHSSYWIGPYRQDEVMMIYEMVIQNYDDEEDNDGNDLDDVDVVDSNDMIVDDDDADVAVDYDNRYPNSIDSMID